MSEKKPPAELAALGLKYKGIRRTRLTDFEEFLTAEWIKIAKWARFLEL